MFDEPVNGLDPEGIRWIRDFFRGLAKEGRTVLVSSHLMSEMALTADEIVVIGRGKFITRGSVDELTATHRGSVLVRCASTDTFAATMRASGAVVNEINDNGLEVSGLDAAAIGQLALTQGVALTELTPQRASLEEVFMDLTADSVDYRGGRA
jgi:ABC-2 type transport system ATP-binding protein